MTIKPDLHIIAGPNVAHNSKRDSSHYGGNPYSEILDKVRELNKEFLICEYSSDNEGDLVRYCRESLTENSYAIVNLGGFTHTSIVIRDALAISQAKFVEVHLSNIYAREDFRRKSLISDLAIGVIAGLKMHSYIAAYEYISHLQGCSGD